MRTDAKTGEQAARAIVWEDPPMDSVTVSYDWFYDELRKQPGEWARYPGTQSAASQWCAQYKDDFQYMSKMQNGVRRVWMRFVGKDS